MKYPHSDRADKYCRDVVSGVVPASKWVRFACQKHLDQIVAQKDADYPYCYSADAADRACEFIELLPHTKGAWAAKGLLLTLEPWQSFFVCSIFGWLSKATGLRKHRRACLWVPRKNGKSILAAAIGNYMFLADNEFGAEIYSGATTESQAWEVYRPAKKMVEKCEGLADEFGVDVRVSNMSVPEDGSRFRPIIGKPGDGSSPHLAIVDEYHEHDADDMVATMESGMGSREQPLLLMITTAGDNISGPCYEMQLDAQKQLEGSAPQDDPTLFALIYGIDEDDDWTTPEAYKKANPNYGVSVYPEYLENRLRDALNSPRKQATYKTKQLNVWVGARDAFFNVQDWKLCADPEITLAQFAGCRAYLGLDLASRVDIAALELLVIGADEQLYQFGKHYLPYDTAIAREHYKTWMGQGVLKVTEGNIIDFDEIKADIMELCSMFEVSGLGYDPHQATKLVTELMAEGAPVVEVRPTVLNFSEPMKELEGLIKSQRITHDGDPVYSWMLSNVTAKLDKKDNVYPTKARNENKIDGPVATMMALRLAIDDDAVSLDRILDDPLTMRHGTNKDD